MQGTKRGKEVSVYFPVISECSEMTETVLMPYVSDIISYRESPARMVPPPYADTHGTPVPAVTESSLSAVSGADGGIRKYRVADVFLEQGEKLPGSGRLSPQQAKALFAIMHCRTGTYGYHADICDQCGFVGISYNSCRNRHCPRCQGIAKQRWVGDRIGELLPVPYHHVVFTVPSYISMLSLYNQKLI
jgi:hypothetical protein